MEIELDERMRDLIGNVAEKHGFNKFKIGAESGSSKGDNYLGTITKIKVTDEATDKSLDLIMKSASTNADFRTILAIEHAFNRENYFYANIIPVYNELLSEYGVEHLNIFPELLDSDMKIPELLIMDDMKAKGYIMKNRTEPLDIHHVRVVMKEYGRFHALYYALKEIHPEKCSELTKSMEEAFFRKMDLDNPASTESVNRTHERVLKAFLPEDIQARKCFEEFTNDTLKKILKILEPTAAGRFAVFNHGDSWVNNMLFFYEQKESIQPSQVCLLDFQLSRIGSPALDLSYFIYTCTDQNLREKHFDQLMQIYHDAMKDQLQNFSLDVNNFLGLEELHEQMRQFSIFGIYMSIQVMHLMLSDKEEIPDFQNISLNDDDFNAYHYVSKNEGRYRERIRGVILDCVDRNYL